MSFNLMLLSLILNITTISSNLHQNAMEKDNNADILAITRQLTELMIKKDTIGINNIVNNDFTLTHITGYIQSKSEWFSEIESERMKYYSYKEIKTTVNTDGNRAYFVGQNLLDARIWGTRHQWRLQQNMELIKRNGKWIILKSVATTF